MRKYSQGIYMYRIPESSAASASKACVKVVGDEQLKV